MQGEINMAEVTWREFEELFLTTADVRAQLSD